MFKNSGALTRIFMHISCNLPYCANNNPAISTRYPLQPHAYKLKLNGITTNCSYKLGSTAHSDQEASLKILVYD